MNPPRPPRHQAVRMHAAATAPSLDARPPRRLHRGRRAALRLGEVLKTGEGRARPQADAPAAAARLVERCKAKEPAAFRELYAQYSRQVASQLMFLVPRADVEDALQDVFVEVFRSIHRFEGRSAFTTWLYRVAVHVAMKSRRKATRAKVDVKLLEDPQAADPAPGPGEVALSRERLAQAELLLERLSPKKRTVLVLHDLRGVDAHEIAELTGTNLFTVRTRLFYARREFERLAAQDPALQEFFTPAPEEKP